MMKRKKWSESEEQTLLDRYSDLVNSGTLSKLKTREKKFKPIAEHVNSVHHLQDPLNFPFKWSWRDVSIKVQNMRHQYLGVKQKIRVSDTDFDWSDGQNHWENFLRYKDVFGDVELESKPNSSKFEDDDGLGFGFGIDSEGIDGDEEDDDDENDEGENSGSEKRRNRKRFKILSAQVLDLKDGALRREEERRERECGREAAAVEREQRRMLRTDLDKNDLGMREMELEERYIMWSRREMERRVRLERRIDEERRRRIKMEEMWELDKMEWREKMVGMQIEHEKQMIQMHAEACQNQLQVLGVVARLMCQFFGAPSDGLGALPPQVLQNLQHPGELDGGVKPDAGSPSGFL